MFERNVLLGAKPFFSVCALYLCLLMAMVVTEVLTPVPEAALEISPSPFLAFKPNPDAYERENFYSSLLVHKLALKCIILWLAFLKVHFK